MVSMTTRLPAAAVQPRCLSPVVRARLDRSPVVRQTPLGKKQCLGQAPLLPTSSRSRSDIEASVEPLLPCEPTQGQTALLIFFHGLAMSGPEFGIEFEKGIAKRMPWLQLHCPDAPKQAVTYLGGENHRAWFDLQEMPVSIGMDHDGLQEMAARVHDMIRQAEKNGIPASRIVLGGFSQGGALAMLAGLTYDHPVAGIAAFSAWLPRSLQKVCRHKSTPIFMGHGDEDRAVPCVEGLATHRALKDLGFTKVGFSKYTGLPHGFVPEEFGEVESFVLQELPKVAKPTAIPPRPSKLRKQDVKLAEASTDEGSGSDSPPTTDDEFSGPARLRQCASLMIKSSTNQMKAARCASPQVKHRVLTSGNAPLSTKQSKSVVHSFAHCSSPAGSSHGTALQIPRISPTPSFFPQRGPGANSCQLQAGVAKSFSCQRPSYVGDAACIPQSSAIGNASPISARSSFRLRSGVSQSLSFSPSPAVWACRLAKAN